MRPLALIAAVIALPLAACVTVFPESEPQTLYRFGAEAPRVEAPAGQPISVRLGRIDFSRAAAGDRILTVIGNEAAAVARARWVAPAAVLFDEAVERAFDSAGGRTRLVTRGEAVRSDYLLGLDVDAFEARYDQGGGAPPQVVVEVRALLTRASDRTVVGERAFTARVRAGDNRMSSIVPAYDVAVTQVLGDLVLWVNKAGA